MGGIGSGRPPYKVRNQKSRDVVRGVKTSNMTPLDYMLKVMNDLTADDPRRDRMAVAAAPYCHPKVSEVRTGKKDLAAENAVTAGIGTSWSGDLEFEQQAN